MEDILLVVVAREKNLLKMLLLSLHPSQIIILCRLDLTSVDRSMNWLRRMSTTAKVPSIHNPIPCAVTGTS